VTDPARGTAVVLEGTTVVRTGRGLRRTLVAEVSWTVGAGEQWAVLGPNGAGKTTLLRIASARLHPSSGRATILGERLGRTYLPTLRRRISVVERALQFFPAYTSLDVVLTGVTGTTSILTEHVDEHVRLRALELLATVSAEELAERPFRDISEGERARVLLARALVGETALVVLDEAVAGLDLPGRELFLEAVASIACDRPDTAMIFATHHLEELPTTISHALLLAGGRVVSAGTADRMLTDELLTACYGMPVQAISVGGRRFAVGPPSADRVKYRCRT
jgi:iron complex transport system ATP-binding protein